MDVLLGKVTQQAMNYAIRSGVTLTATFALKQSAKLLQSAPKSKVKDELGELQRRLDHKIRIVSPAIDMIELIAARGNTSLESAVALTRELRLDIQNLGQRLARAVISSEDYRTGSSRNLAALKVENENEMSLIIHDMRELLIRIEDAVPLISLALTTSGAKLSTQLPPTVSPSRLLQASNLITAGDAQYTVSPRRASQIGPTFILSLYMLFSGYDRPETEEDVRNTTWKEVVHKAHVTLRRVPLDVLSTTGSGSAALQAHEISTERTRHILSGTASQVRAESRADEFAYQLMIVEDYDDDRHHDFEDENERPGPFDQVRLAGIREMIPIHEISKIFYADTSKVLNIGSDTESNHPVLLLRRDIHAVPPRRMVEREHTEDIQDSALNHPDDGKVRTQEEKQYVEQVHSDPRPDPWQLPPSLDPEWLALEVYAEAEDTGSDADADLEEDDLQDLAIVPEQPGSSQLSLSLSSLNINSPANTNASNATPNMQQSSPQQRLPPIKTSLSMLELLLRLTSLQQFQQQSHLSIPDELLNFFLEESASTGAGGDEQHRQAIRADARRRVGWDPYDESPLKRRGEEYQYADGSHQGSPREGSQRLGYSSSMTTPTSVRGNGSPGGLNTQNRSRTGTPDNRSGGSLSASTGGYKSLTMSNRPEWLKQPSEGRTGSPLRSAVHSDEGIGTSPASMHEEQK